MPTTEGSPVARAKRLPIALIAAWLLSLFGLTACVSSPSVPVQPPAFELKSSEALASVDIRDPLPTRTDRESEALVETGMLRALPTLTLAPVTAPFPERRFVWHVSADIPYGTSRLILNVFEGSRAVAYDQEDVGSSPSNGALLAAIESMTRRLSE
jgi:hypothetical protein